MVLLFFFVRSSGESTGDLRKRVHPMQFPCCWIVHRQAAGWAESPLRRQSKFSCPPSFSGTRRKRRKEKNKNWFFVPSQALEEIDGSNDFGSGSELFSSHCQSNIAQRFIIILNNNIILEEHPISHYKQ
ncbi:hypothetical protein IV203_028725 [Nitzschia inconspicua]|uniref:Uncharacterized protein n=1 Tax=Nitzschia inconspicua TaxID=303405 RepID=A0A9K3Q0K1_9STRA|nr:hypothetical protein IV203_028725 [Nitzschia inconspicua]